MLPMGVMDEALFLFALGESLHMDPDLSACMVQRAFAADLQPYPTWDRPTTTGYLITAEVVRDAVERCGVDLTELWYTSD
jgi:hypothetical protein